MKNLFKYLVFAFFLPIYAGAQQSKNDSLLSLIKTDKEDTNKINHLNDLAFSIYAMYPDSTISLSNQALKIAEKLNFRKGLAKAYGNRGIGNSIKDNYSLAIENFTSALKIDEELQDKDGMARRLGNIGRVYANQGNYPHALDYYLKALKINEELGNKDGMARQLSNVGSLYYNIDEYPKALESHFKALKLGEELNDKSRIAFELGSIGNVYDEQAKISVLKKSPRHIIDSLYKKALDYDLRALIIKEELGNKSGISSQLGNIGNIFKERAMSAHPDSVVYRKINYKMALDYYYRALKLNEEFGEKGAIWLGNIGELYFQTNKYAEAEKYLLNSLRYIDDKDAEWQFQKILSELYSKTGRHELAMEYYKKSIALRDTLFSQEKGKEITRKEMDYEFEKKEAVANAIHKSELESQQEIANEKDRKQKIVIWSVLIGLLLVVGFAGFVFRSLRVTNKQKKIIEKSKLIIEEKNKDITDSINYAKRIQKAMLPHRKDIWDAFPQSFVLFKPKAILSGDFYFFFRKKESVFIAVADATGHGIPASLLTMIGSDKLADAVSVSSEISEILSLLNKGVKTALKQTDDDESTRDGMDIALCKVDLKNHNVKYAGANRPIWIIRKGQGVVEEIKATKKAIGGLTEDGQHFDEHNIQMKEGDTFYLTSDGYADTFGKTGKKLMTKKLKEILLNIQDKSMKEQEKYLDEFLETWKNGIEPVDDVCILGIRIS